jgi:hypothetical protein
LTFAVLTRLVMIETRVGGTKKTEGVPKGRMFAAAKVNPMELRARR